MPAQPAPPSAGRALAVARMTLTDDIRAAAARVRARPSSVRIVTRRIEPYARTLPAESPPTPDLEAPTTRPAPPSACSSTRSTSAAAGSRRSTSRRACPGSARWRPRCAPAALDGAELEALTRAEVAATFGQDPDHVLMAHFARHLNELGERIDGSFLGLRPRPRLRRGPRDDARELADLARRLARTPAASVPLLQARADRRRRPRPRRARPRGRPRARSRCSPTTSSRTSCASTACSSFDDDLVARIDDGVLLEHGSPEEVEIRAVALHAVELLVHAHPATPPPPRWTGSCGPAARSRATRRTPATAPAPPPTDPPKPKPGGCGEDRDAHDQGRPHVGRARA